MNIRIKRISCAWCGDTLEGEELQRKGKLPCALCEDLRNRQDKDFLEFEEDPDDRSTVF